MVPGGVKDPLISQETRSEVKRIHERPRSCPSSNQGQGNKSNRLNDPKKKSRTTGQTEEILEIKNLQSHHIHESSQLDARSIEMNQSPTIKEHASMPHRKTAFSCRSKKQPKVRYPHLKTGDISCDPCGSNDSNSKLPSASGKGKIIQTFTGNSCFKSLTPSLKEGIEDPPPEMNAIGKTCSSILKNRKLPRELELNPGGTKAEGTSVRRVCHYSYCSLNGHEHKSSLPLKQFLMTKRKMMKSQRNLAPKELSPGGKLLDKRERKTNEEWKAPDTAESVSTISDDFISEIFAQSNEESEWPSMFEGSDKFEADSGCVTANTLQGKLWTEHGKQSEKAEPSKNEVSSSFNGSDTIEGATGNEQYEMLHEKRMAVSAKDTGKFDFSMDGIEKCCLTLDLTNNSNQGTDISISKMGYVINSPECTECHHEAESQEMEKTLHLLSFISDSRKNTKKLLVGETKISAYEAPKRRHDEENKCNGDCTDYSEFSADLSTMLYSLISDEDTSKFMLGKQIQGELNRVPTENDDNFCGYNSSKRRDADPDYSNSSLEIYGTEEGSNTSQINKVVSNVSDVSFELLEQQPVHKNDQKQNDAAIDINTSDEISDICGHISSEMGMEDREIDGHQIYKYNIVEIRAAQKKVAKKECQQNLLGRCNQDEDANNFIASSVADQGSIKISKWIMKEDSDRTGLYDEISACNMRKYPSLCENDVSPYNGQSGICTLELKEGNLETNQSKESICKTMTNHENESNETDSSESENRHALTINISAGTEGGRRVEETSQTLLNNSYAGGCDPHLQSSHLNFSRENVQGQSSTTSITENVAQNLVVFSSLKERNIEEKADASNITSKDFPEVMILKIGMQEVADRKIEKNRCEHTELETNTRVQINERVNENHNKISATNVNNENSSEMPYLVTLDQNLTHVAWEVVEKDNMKVEFEIKDDVPHESDIFSCQQDILTLSPDHSLNSCSLEETKRQRTQLMENIFTKLTQGIIMEQFEENNGKFYDNHSNVKSTDRNGSVKFLSDNNSKMNEESNMSMIHNSANNILDQNPSLIDGLNQKNNSYGLKSEDQQPREVIHSLVMLGPEKSFAYGEAIEVSDLRSEYAPRLNISEADHQDVADGTFSSLLPGDNGKMRNENDKPENRNSLQETNRSQDHIARLHITVEANEKNAGCKLDSTICDAKAEIGCLQHNDLFLPFNNPSVACSLEGSKKSETYESDEKNSKETAQVKPIKDREKAAHIIDVEHSRCNTPSSKDGLQASGDVTTSEFMFIDQNPNQNEKQLLEVHVLESSVNISSNIDVHHSNISSLEDIVSEKIIVEKNIELKHHLQEHARAEMSGQEVTDDKYKVCIEHVNHGITERMELINEDYNNLILSDNSKINGMIPDKDILQARHVRDQDSSKTASIVIKEGICTSEASTTSVKDQSEKGSALGANQSNTVEECDEHTGKNDVVAKLFSGYSDERKNAMQDHNNESPKYECRWESFATIPYCSLPVNLMNDNLRQDKISDIINKELEDKAYESAENNKKRDMKMSNKNSSKTLSEGKSRKKEIEYVERTSCLTNIQVPHECLSLKVHDIVIEKDNSKCTIGSEENSKSRKDLFGGYTPTLGNQVKIVEEHKEHTNKNDNKLCTGGTMEDSDTAFPELEWADKESNIGMKHSFVDNVPDENYALDRQQKIESLDIDAFHIKQFTYLKTESQCSPIFRDTHKQISDDQEVEQISCLTESQIQVEEIKQTMHIVEEIVSRDIGTIGSSENSKPRKDLFGGYTPTLGNQAKIVEEHKEHMNKNDNKLCTGGTVEDSDTALPEVEWADKASNIGMKHSFVDTVPDENYALDRQPKIASLDTNVLNIEQITSMTIESHCSPISRDTAKLISDDQNVEEISCLTESQIWVEEINKIVHIVDERDSRDIDAAYGELGEEQYKDHNAVVGNEDILMRKNEEYISKINDNLYRTDGYERYITHDNDNKSSDISCLCEVSSTNQIQKESRTAIGVYDAQSDPVATSSAKEVFTEIIVYPHPQTEDISECATSKAENEKQAGYELQKEKSEIDELETTGGTMISNVELLDLLLSVNSDLNSNSEQIEDASSLLQMQLFNDNFREKVLQMARGKCIEGKMKTLLSLCDTMDKKSYLRCETLKYSSNDQLGPNYSRDYQEITGQHHFGEYSTLASDKTITVEEDGDDLSCTIQTEDKIEVTAGEMSASTCLEFLEEDACSKNFETDSNELVFKTADQLMAISRQTDEDLQKFTVLNRQMPKKRPVQPNSQAEVVFLKYQAAGIRKSPEEWMTDYILRRIITKLAHSQKRKVPLLVEAYEAIMPLFVCNTDQDDNPNFSTNI